MIAIATHNSEKLLLADLREAHISNPKHRCLHLRFSQAKEDKSVWLPLLKRSVRETLDDAISQIYVTYDNDVFIQGWGLTHRRLDELLTRLAYELDSSSLQGIASLYEIGVHWDALERLCMAKMQNSEKYYAEQKQKDKAKVDSDESGSSKGGLMENIDSSLVATIAQRRAKRTHPIVLVAEDDLFSQVLVKKSLESDYMLCIAKDGQGAIMNYIKYAPDILFLDIELPDINGQDVLKIIKALDKDAYVVMFSGNGDRTNVITALDNGAQGFVGKPFTRDKLVQYIERAPFNKNHVPTLNDLEPAR